MLRQATGRAAGLDPLSLLRRTVAATDVCHVSGSRQYATGSGAEKDMIHLSGSLTNTGARAGPGGRSSISGVTATIFGPSGFLGRYVATLLARQGSQVVCPYRCDDLDVQHLRVMGDLGQVVTIPDFSARDDDAIRKAVAQSNVVINLIGSERETPRFKFEEVHIDIAQRIAKAAAESGTVERLIHVSCLGASADAPSRRLRTKAAGEEAVREAFPGATILKPATIVGIEDRFFNSYAVLSKNLPFLPVVGGGDARVQPVYVRDVAEAFSSVLKDKGTAGKTYALAGPKVYTRRQLVQLTYETMREKNASVHLPTGIARLAAKPREWLLSKGIAIPSLTMYTADAIEEAVADNVLSTASGELTFADLGINPQRIDLGLPIEHVRYYRVGGYEHGTTEGTVSTA